MCSGSVMDMLSFVFLSCMLRWKKGKHPSLKENNQNQVKKIYTEYESTMDKETVVTSLISYMISIHLGWEPKLYKLC